MQDPPPDARLADALVALGSPARLALLRRLRAPRALGEIEVEGEGSPPGRNLPRQSVRRHLDQLLGVGVVSTLPAGEDRRSPVRYTLNHQAIFALTEGVRELAGLRPVVEPETPTVGAGTSARALPPGPCLVLVKGLHEGTAFPLTGGTEWVVGRKRGLAIALDFDPYISSENSRVLLAGARHWIEDAPGSRNGTTVNFERVPRGARIPLRHGDIVGAGRTLLVYREA